MQLLVPENKQHCLPLTQSVVCVEEMKFGLLAQNCINPGLSTLCFLLATSINDIDVDKMMSKFTASTGCS
jgi:hypothetical protein